MYFILVSVFARCLVSFTVEQNALTLSEIKEHLIERNSSLEALGYPILEVSQGTYIHVCVFIKELASYIF